MTRDTVHVCTVQGRCLGGVVAVRCPLEGAPPMSLKGNLWEPPSMPLIGELTFVCLDKRN